MELKSIEEIEESADPEGVARSIDHGVVLAVQQAPSVVITSADDYVQAVEFLRQIKSHRRKVQHELGPSIAQAHRTHKELVALRRRHDDQLAGAELVLKRVVTEWVTTQDRAAAAEAEAQRQAMETTAKAMRLEQASILRSNGDAKGADAVMSEPLIAPPVVQRRAVPEVEGISYRKKWAAEVTDLPALIAHCAAHPQWVKVLAPNHKELNRLVQALRGNLELPGVVVSEDTVPVVSATKDETGDIWDRYTR